MSRTDTLQHRWHKGIQKGIEQAQANHFWCAKWYSTHYKNCRREGAWSKADIRSSWATSEAPLYWEQGEFDSAYYLDHWWLQHHHQHKLKVILLDFITVMLCTHLCTTPVPIVVGKLVNVMIISSQTTCCTILSNVGCGLYSSWYSLGHVVTS